MECVILAQCLVILFKMQNPTIQIKISKVYTIPECMSAFAEASKILTSFYDILLILMLSGFSLPLYARTENT